MPQSSMVRLCALGVTLVASSAFAQNLSSQDRSFMMDAAKGGMMEVDLGHMAVDKGTDPAVKKFGQRMITDHSKANGELMDLAKRKGVTLPADNPNAASSMSFAKKTGPAFDKGYAKDMVEDHQKDIAEFEKEAKSGTDPDVKSWAQNTLPTLRSHLTDAQSLPK